MKSEMQWLMVTDDVTLLRFQNNIAEVVVSDKTICIGKNKEGYFAFAATCPHSGALLKDGFVDAMGNVVCPLHKYRFCMRTGRNVSGEGYFLKRWPVRQEGTALYVGLPLLGLY